MCKCQISWPWSWYWCFSSSLLSGSLNSFYLFRRCYGMNCVPPPSPSNSYVEAPHFRMQLLGDGVFKEVIKVKRSHKGRHQCDRSPSKKRRLGHRHTQGWPCEDTERRRPSVSQGERPQKESRWHVDLALAASRTVWQSLLFNPHSSVCGTCYSSPSWLIHYVFTFLKLHFLFLLLFEDIGHPLLRHLLLCWDIIEK